MCRILREASIFLVILLSVKVYGQTTTAAPTTAAHTTVAPTTAAPTTAAPTTAAPTTAAPTTAAPTTAAPTTVAPTTAAPTTVAPTTVAPTTVAPTTAVPTTTAATTASPTNCTNAPICKGLTTAVCGFQALVDSCPVLCHANTSCTVTGGTRVRSSFRLTSETYNSNLAISSSTEFISLKGRVENMIRIALFRELGSRFVSIVVRGFTKGSVIVDAVVTITEQENSDAFKTVQTALERSGVTGLDASSVKVGVCSAEYVNVNNQCLMFGKQRLTWSASGSACSRHNGRLVVPTDFQKMTAYIIRNNLFYWQYWVGASATDISNPGTYTWLDGTTVDSSMWYAGFPLTPGTNGVTIGQSCVKLHPNSDTSNGLIAAWDSNCNGSNTYRYICEEL